MKNVQAGDQAEYVGNKAENFSKRFFVFSGFLGRKCFLTGDVSEREDGDHQFAVQFTQHPKATVYYFFGSELKKL